MISLLPEEVDEDHEADDEAGVHVDDGSAAARLPLAAGWHGPGRQRAWQPCSMPSHSCTPPARTVGVAVESPISTTELMAARPATADGTPGGFAPPPPPAPQPAAVAESPAQTGDFDS